MSLPIRVLPQADDDLEEIAVYIAGGSVDAAMRFLDAAQNTINSLLENSHRGALLRTQNERLSGVRWVPVVGFNTYMVFYLADTEVRVIRVLHGARDLPALFDEDV